MYEDCIITTKYLYKLTRSEHPLTNPHVIIIIFFLHTKKIL